MSYQQSKITMAKDKTSLTRKTALTLQPLLKTSTKSFPLSTLSQDNALPIQTLTKERNIVKSFSRKAHDESINF